jgi:hypothetical protein
MQQFQYENMNRWIVWIVTLVIFSRLHINIKFKFIFKINIVKFLIFNVFIDFNGNHHNFNFFLCRLGFMLQWAGPFFLGFDSLLQHVVKNWI